MGGGGRESMRVPYSNYDAWARETGTQGLVIHPAQWFAIAPPVHITFRPLGRFRRGPAVLGDPTLVLEALERY